MSIYRLACFALAVLTASFTLPAAPISLTNGGFEDGLSGWVTTGNVQGLGPTSVVTFDNIVWDVAPNGSSMAALNSNGIQANTLDAFFGLPGNTLQSLNQQGVHPDPSAGGALTTGAGIYQDFAGNAGDTVTVFYNYVARDYISFNDPAYGVLVSPTGFQTQVISSIYGGGIEVGTAGNSGWRSLTFTLDETGSHRLGFAVTNDRDTILDAALFLDAAAGGTTTTDPGELVPGSTPLFPVLPDSTPFPNTFVFNTPAPGLWYDPPFAEAYTYTLSGGALFNQFSTPAASFGFGDLVFTDLSGGNASFVAQAGVLYDIDPSASFQLSGLADGLIDFQAPGFSTAFPAFLNWSGTATQLQIDITPQDPGGAVPEPSTYALFASGIGAVVVMKRRRA